LFVFVDIDGIVDHYSLNFLIIIQYIKWKISGKHLFDDVNARYINNC